MKRIIAPAFVLIGVAVAVALVFLVAPNANPNPDGLEKVAADNGLDTRAAHALADGPLAEYGVPGWTTATWEPGWPACSVSPQPYHRCRRG